MQYQSCECVDQNANQGYVSNPDSAHTNFFPVGAFGLGLGLGLLPWAVGGGYGRGYCGGPYCGGGYYGGYGPGWRGGWW